MFTTSGRFLDGSVARKQVATNRVKMHAHRCCRGIGVAMNQRINECSMFVAVNEPPLAA
jgi:hypothetical protein